MWKAIITYVLEKSWHREKNLNQNITFFFFFFGVETKVMTFFPWLNLGVIYDFFLNNCTLIFFFFPVFLRGEWHYLRVKKKLLMKLFPLLYFSLSFCFSCSVFPVPMQTLHMHTLLKHDSYFYLLALNVDSLLTKWPKMLLYWYDDQKRYFSLSFCWWFLIYSIAYFNESSLWPSAFCIINEYYFLFYCLWQLINSSCLVLNYKVIFSNSYM